MERIAMTSARSIENEQELINQLFEEGLDILHIRKPKHKKSEVERLISSIPKKYHTKLVMHKYPDLAIRFKLKGVHIPRENRKKSIVQTLFKWKMRLRHPRLIFTTTFNSIESLLANRADFDYVFLGPIFTERTHYTMDEEAGKNVLKKAIENSRQNVFALGGIETKHIPLIDDVGFAGFVLPKSIWKEEENFEVQLKTYLR